ncbi:MAG: multidrug ABC transporter substrate-binding protein [Proteobacteria bacterium]|nr:MAG: multidrug ABC transporter substrate-binding protein [Pseudomonadota bacterium]
MELLKSQLKQVLRRLGRAPLFTAVTVITLAAGVGANTVVFSVLEGVLLKPLPYPQPDQLVGIWLTAPGVNLKEVNSSPSNYFIFREQNQTFQDVGLYQRDSVSVTGLGEPEHVRALDVTDGVLPILGVVPLAGRLFRREDDSPGTQETVMLSYGYWQHKFGGSPSAVGQNVMVDGKSREIIGVLPRKFHFLDEEDAAIVLPLRFDRAKTLLGNFSYEALARLKPGGTIEQASADVARMLPIVERSFPAPPGFSIKLFEQAHFGPNLRPLKQDVIGDVGGTLWILMGSIGLVLLIACANVANLLLVRVEGRRQELAVRAALGAGRARIAAELLTESLLLGILSSLVGLGLAWIALRVLVALAPSGLPRVQQIAIDLPVLLFTLCIALLASVLFGAIPIFKYAGVRLNTGIREGGRALSQSREQHRARSALVVVQVALALVLLICSGLMIRTFRAMTLVQPGFVHASEVQSFRIFIPESQVKEPESVVRMEQEISRRIAAIPGVSSVGITTGIPMDGNRSYDPVFAQDKSYAEGQLPPLQRFLFVTPGLFGTLGTPMIAGRELTWSDTYQKLPVAVVSETMARNYWGSAEKALGKRVRVSSQDDWREVVGVVGDVRADGVSQDAPSTVYWPLLMSHFESDDTVVRREVAFAIRSPRAGTENLLKEVREAVWSANPNLPLADVHTLDYFYRRSMARTSFTLVMLGVAGSMALLLGVVGIYGVIAYSVSQRVREIGIRMALGAQEKVLTGMFVRHGLLLTGIGVTCGLVTAFLAMRLMSSLLFHVNPIDPLTYVAVSLGLVGTAYLASYVPSRRAANVNPVEALRAE